MYPKFKYWRSKKHLANVASLPCQNCGLEGQTQAAHGNEGWMGKGRGIKSSDQFTAALCFACHHDLDAGHTLTKEQKKKMFLDALHSTWFELVKRDMVVLDAPTPLVDN